MNLKRRDFLGRTGTGLVSAGLLPTVFSSSSDAASADGAAKGANERARIGSIGLRYQGSVISEKALPYGDLVALCDVDRHVREQARACFGSRAKIYEDYRDLLDRDDIDVVLIGTPDHWHTKMVIDACRAGKDVYCEKPLTLTIDEGKHLTKAVEETGRVVQVGTWQRSDVRFRQAVEMVRAGRLGKLEKVIVTISDNPTGGPFANVPKPEHINWDLWLGQAPEVPYCEQRGHYTFRWWEEYSGGRMTDWGAHHIDIAQWGIGADRSGPKRIEAKATYPNVENGYNVPTNYSALLTFPNDVTMEIRSKGTIGVRFIGERGELFVTRGSIKSNPAELLEVDPIPRENYKLYSHDLSFQPKIGKLESIENHMRNFFDSIRSRQQPISDVVSQHRSVSSCHLANIAMKLGRPLDWDPENERFVDDSQANAMLSREQRKGFEIG
ncbi:Inositol 2-dehydrogenase [Planctomycetes bacterium Pan216]|uniref:Inositol 2-dehydrogenase n=1 Tax=Kolteria novifilia TaxID=2527975 RepID=A0A518B7S6_9BACT|nr:Inositol 2-dehydrogenase [Planctomycetes bacterium Pan216]